jgi:hypothetical protein
MGEPLPKRRGCGAAVGDQHDSVCDVARCRATGLQWARCDHRQDAPVPHDRDVRTGRWPGQADCERLGWYARLQSGTGWVACGPDEPGAPPVLNRRYTEATWDARAGQWIE